MKIVDVKAPCYRYPAQPLRSTQFGAQEEATRVRVIADNGLEGHGVARAEGEDAFQRECIWQKLCALDRGNHLPELHYGASPLMDIATLHCACAIKNGEYLELLVPEQRYEIGLTDYSALHINAGGCVHAPPGPGLGVAIDWDFIDNHTTFMG